MGLFNFLTETIGFEAGSQNLRILHNGNLIFNEPSQISVDEGGIVTAIGNEAYEEKDLHFIKPINYAISDFQAFEELLKRAIGKGMNGNSFFKPSLIVYASYPTGITQVELRAYRDSAEYSGAKQVHLIMQCFTSAIGMKILFEKKDFILIDFGASKIEVSIFSDSLPIAQSALRIGTWKINKLIKNFISRQYDVTLSDEDIDTLMLSISNKEEIHVKNIAIPISEINELVSHYFVLANDTILESLESISKHPKLSYIQKNGVYFTGGGSANSFLRNKIVSIGELRSEVSKEPHLDSVNGLVEVIKSPETFKDYIIT
jgi:rod shape-determining protein MreB